jgi:leucyl-tRNA synthetase
MGHYNHKEIEAKWQGEWERSRIFEVSLDAVQSGKKSYILDMFPYPSGAGLHVGHPEGYTATDILARKRRMEGVQVLHPMGFDSFGLPAENYAIKTGVHPSESTAANIVNFTRQMKSLGLSFDWSRVFATSDPEYYKWTQWLFLKLYERGLAYKKLAAVNWCEKDQTVLANEQVVNGACERCGSVVVQRELSQWFFKVTEYADRLLDDVESLDWPDKIKAMQRNWIGRSEGAEITFKGDVSNGVADFDVVVYTTRPDTLYGVSYVVLAPEHELVSFVTVDSQKSAVEAYVAATQKKNEIDRQKNDREKTGVFTGAHVIHPITGAKVPVWIADYVLGTYGTGAVMGVPAHDERDAAFASTNGLPVIDVEVDEAKKWELAERAGGKRVTKYRLRDWLVSRQRYWGAPIPMINCDACGMQPVPVADLPVLLPTDVDFRPTGESPLARSASFQYVQCPKCGAAARRESDTMDTFVDSSWYFLRYCSPKLASAAFDDAAVKYWCPVDVYVGGAEHAVLHLLFARFFTKALHDMGILEFDEPFVMLRNQGLILGEDGEKMSKSKGNVINPDDVVSEHGADTLRMYEMFMGDFEDAKPWDTKGITGVRRFLDRMFALTESVVAANGAIALSPEVDKMLHKTIAKVTSDIEAFKFNTAIAAMMTLINEWKNGQGTREQMKMFVQILSPFAPHVAEEMWQMLGGVGMISVAAWPKFDAAKIVDDVVEVVVQVNGKVRERLMMPVGSSDDVLREAALANEIVQKFIDGKAVKQVIIARGRLVNIVV